MVDIINRNQNFYEIFGKFFWFIIGEMFIIGEQFSYFFQYMLIPVNVRVEKSILLLVKIDLCFVVKHLIVVI